MKISLWAKACFASLILAIISCNSIFQTWVMFNELVFSIFVKFNTARCTAVISTDGTTLQNDEKVMKNAND